MKVAAVEAIPVAYPEPNDHGSTRHLLLVRITSDDGAIGWGEAVTMWPEATDAADAANANARKLGFERHLFAVDYLRALADLQLERRDFGTAEHLIEEVLRICERRWPLYEFLALLDQARIWAARGQVREALAAVESARPVLAGASSVLQARADEQEAVLRLSLGDLRTPADLANGLVPQARRRLLLARIALAAGDHRTALGHLAATTPDGLTPRHALEREILVAAAAIMREDPAAAGILGNALHTARRKGFLSTVVTTSPQVTGYLIENAARLRMDPFIERIIAAALEIRAAQPAAARGYPMIAEPPSRRISMRSTMSSGIALRFTNVRWPSSARP